MSIVVPPGVSGRRAKYDPANVSQETLANELALLQLGDFEPLNLYVNLGDFMSEIQEFSSDWVDYLPRTDRPNNRKGLTLTNLPGLSHKDAPSLAQASFQAGRVLSETDFTQPTELYHGCPSLHGVLNEWDGLGRSFIVRSDTGGYFVPHRDHPSLPRDVFRIVVFLNNCGPLQYDWLMDDKKANIQMGQAYYVNTRKTHRTISWVDNSMHLILNIPFTSSNVAKVIANLAHSH